ncbi:glycosyltransferase [uncultured Jatrophihabitans sp.]|uniref:glycosyltransferase n=1 Tax=uncultured Jatrophihabitans sp. TaxID=1610747 RepID=UPI0035C9623E
MRILIVGINYAPELTGIAPYTTGLAEHLARDHEVTVLTGLPHYPDWQVAPHHRAWRTEERTGNVRVIRLGHYVPKNPDVLRRGLYEVTWSARAAAAGRSIPTDLVVAVVPALLGAHAARSLSAHHGVPLGIIVQDIMGKAAEQSGARGGRLVSTMTTRIERSAMRQVAGVSTIHPRLAIELGTLTDTVPDVIYNWTHVAPRPRLGTSFREELGWRDDEVIALHSGNMGGKQNLEVVVDAARLAELEGSPVRFVLAGGGHQRTVVERYARGCSNVSFVPSIEDDDYVDFLASADVLLVNERPGMSEMSLPSKLTSYLVAGRPIVAATNEHSPTADFIRASGGGIVTPAGNHAQLLDAISKVTADNEWSGRLAADGRAFAEEHLSKAAAMSAYDLWIAGLAAQH